MTPWVGRHSGESWRNVLRRAAIRTLPLPTRLKWLRVLRRIHLWPRPVTASTSAQQLPALESIHDRSAVCPLVLWLATNPWNRTQETSECLVAQVARTLGPVWYVEPGFTAATGDAGAEPIAGVRRLPGGGDTVLASDRPDVAEPAAEALATAIVARLDAEGPCAGWIICESPRWLSVATRLHDALDWPMVPVPAAGEATAILPGQTGQQRAHTLVWTIKDSFPLVSIAVVTFNNLALTRLCLDSLLFETGYPDIEVIVVDNASTDGTQEWLEAYTHEHPAVRLIANQHNAGFAAANNQAIAAARGSFFCFLNNDTVLSRHWLFPLVRALRRDSTLGLVGPVTNAAGNEARIEVGYHEVDAMADWAQNWVRTHQGQVLTLDMLGLYCALTRRDVIDRVGLLDERFRIGFFEDDDWCRRLRAAGFSIQCRKDSFVHHWQGATFALLGEERLGEVYEESRRLYRHKWAGRTRD